MRHLLLLILLLAGTTVLAQTTWYPVSVPTQKKLNTIAFPSSDVGYIGGNDSLLLKTTNGGRTWQHLSYTGITFMPGGEHIINMQFLSEMVGYIAVGPYTGVYKTIDGGVTWTAEATAGNLCFNRGLYFFNASSGFAGGSGCFEGEKINRLSGGTWTQATLSFSNFEPDDLIADIDFRNGSLGIAASLGGRILRTTDGGLNWDSIPSPYGVDVPVTAVMWIDDTLCYATYAEGGEGFGLLRSDDAGLTWVQDWNSATFYYPDFFTLHRADNGIVYTGGKPGWDDNGLIFEQDPTATTGWGYADVSQPVYDIASHSGSIVFAVGDTGMVVVNTLPANLGITNAEQANSLVVYPNPASDLLHFSLAEPTPAAVTIYTINGVMVWTQTQETETIDVSGLVAGMYLLEIVAGETMYRTSFVRR